MVTAAAAGVTPLDFRRMTLGEIVVLIDGYNLRERQTIRSRVSAVLRGLSVFSKKQTNPFKGIEEETENKAGVGSASFKKASAHFIRRADGGGPSKPKQSESTSRWLFGV